MKAQNEAAGWLPRCFSRAANSQERRPKQKCKARAPEVVEYKRDNIEYETQTQLLSHAPAIREVARRKLEEVASNLLDGHEHADLTER